MENAWLVQKNSQYNSLLLILQVIPSFKPKCHANHYFTEDFTPTVPTVLRARCKIQVVSYAYVGTISAGATLKMLVARKLRPNLEIAFKLGYI